MGREAAPAFRSPAFRSDLFPAFPRLQINSRQESQNAQNEITDSRVYRPIFFYAFSFVLLVPFCGPICLVLCLNSGTRGPAPACSISLRTLPIKAFRRRAQNATLLFGATQSATSNMRCQELSSASATCEISVLS